MYKQKEKHSKSLRYPFRVWALHPAFYANPNLLHFLFSFFACRQISSLCLQSSSLCPSVCLARFFNTEVELTLRFIIYLCVFWAFNFFSFLSFFLSLSLSLSLLGNSSKFRLSLVLVRIETDLVHGLSLQFKKTGTNRFSFLLCELMPYMRG